MATSPRKKKKKTKNLHFMATYPRSQDRGNKQAIKISGTKMKQLEKLIATNQIN